MKDYFSGREFYGKTELNAALNRLAEIATFFIADRTACECIEALRDYNMANKTCAFFEGLYYGSVACLVDAHVFLEASVSMIHYKYFYLEQTETEQPLHSAGDA